MSESPISPSKRTFACWGMSIASMHLKAICKLVHYLCEMILTAFNSDVINLLMHAGRSTARHASCRFLVCSSIICHVILHIVTQESPTLHHIDNIGGLGGWQHGLGRICV